MSKYYVGKNHTELTDWLLHNWLKDGPPVCFVEGFSGVGKTSVARTLIKNSGMNAVMIDMPDAGSDQTDNLFLNLATELSQIEINNLADAVTEGHSVDQALCTLLNKPLLIVIDEFQRAMTDDSGKPTSALINFLRRLANRPNAPGRVLILTNQVVERSKWSEAYEIRTLNGLAPADAEYLLGELLDRTGRNNEISQERRRDVVNWLGCNPRAIYVLVASLERSSLDELIGISPEIWEARTRDVSAELLHRLERELLEKTIELLKPETATLLRQLSVHRKAVKAEAMEKLLPRTIKFESIRDELISRFLMEQHTGWFSLNPVVREISFQKLKQKPKELKQGHSHAADLYMRHFQAQMIVDSNNASGKLGGYFVEARYHLVQAGRDEALGQIAARFESHLKNRYSPLSPVPTQLNELNERIATIMALLETPGAKGLEFYLARLYEARGSENDLQKALHFIQRATEGKAPADNWVLRLRLEAKFNDPFTVMLVAREAITKVTAQAGAADIYSVAGKLLAKADRINEAITFLKDGLTKIPADKSLFVIYQILGELLAKTNKPYEAIELLKDGMCRIPRQFNRFILAEAALMMLSATQDLQALDDLTSGTGPLALDPPQLALSKVMKLIVERQWESAAQLAGQEYANFQHYRPLLEIGVFCNLCLNELNAAEALMQKIPLHGRGDQAYWLGTWIALKQGNRKAALEFLSIYLASTVDDQTLDEEYLLRLWNTAPTEGNRADLAFYFPILPTSLTSLPNDVIRIPYGPSVLDHTIANKKSTETAVDSKPETKTNSKDETVTRHPLKVFISYSRKDEDFKDDLTTMLAGLQHRGIIDAWQDRCIEVGDEWYQEIQDVMSKCDLAILLISANFIASRFIRSEELPKLLNRRIEEGLRIMPIIVKQCMWQSEPVIKDIQVMPRDGKPIIAFSKDNGDRDQVWTEIAKAIESQTK